MIHMGVITRSPTPKKVLRWTSDTTIPWFIIIFPYEVCNLGPIPSVWTEPYPLYLLGCFFPTILLFMGTISIYPLVRTKIAIENHHAISGKTLDFNMYVSHFQMVASTFWLAKSLVFRPNHKIPCIPLSSVQVFKTMKSLNTRYGCDQSSTMCHYDAQ